MCVCVCVHLCACLLLRCKEGNEEHCVYTRYMPCTVKSYYWGGNSDHQWMFVFATANIFLFFFGGGGEGGVFFFIVYL